MAAGELKKTFFNKVDAGEPDDIVQTVSVGESTTTVLGGNKLSIYQYKKLPSDKTSDTNPVTELTLNGIVIGSVYEIIICAAIDDNGGFSEFHIKDGVVDILKAAVYRASDATDFIEHTFERVIHKATNSTYQFRFNHSGGSLLGVNSFSETWVGIRRLDDYEQNQTTAFS